MEGHGILVGAHGSCSVHAVVDLGAKTTWSYDEDGMTTNSTSGTIDRDHLDQFLKKHDARVMLDAKLGHLTHKMIYQAWKESVHAQLPHIG